MVIIVVMVFLFFLFFFFSFSFSFSFFFLLFLCTSIENNNYWNIIVGSGDINECTLGIHNCDTNAICTNTPRSFTCKCKIGYSGNGFSCEGFFF